jgi:Bacteriophage minor capsid protein
MLLDELGEYLQALGKGTLAIDLFLSKLPVDAQQPLSPDEIVALVETPGFPPEYVHVPGGPQREHPVIQLLVRGKANDYAAPRLRAQDIYLTLGAISNQTLSGTFYLSCLPLGSIAPLKEDDFGRPILQCQFKIDKSI